MSQILKPLIFTSLLTAKVCSVPMGGLVVTRAAGAAELGEFRSDSVGDAPVPPRKLHVGCDCSDFAVLRCDLGPFLRYGCDFRAAIWGRPNGPDLVPKRSPWVP